MASIDTISTANKAVAGRGYDSALYALQRHKGRAVNLLTKVDLGAPLLAVAAGIVNGATGGTEAPNANTKTFTAATQGSSPLDPSAALASATIKTVDGTRTCMVLDVPRNVTAAVNTAVGNITVTVTGYDQYRAKMVETLTIAAAGTSAVGKKAFKYIWSIALTSDGNDAAKAFNVGFGSVLGLPFKLAEKSDLISTWFDDAVDSATVVAAVATTPSATTGDVRGTVTIAGTLNGTKTLKLWMHVSESDASTRNGLLGVPNYAG